MGLVVDGLDWIGIRGTLGLVGGLLYLTERGYAIKAST